MDSEINARVEVGGVKEVGYNADGVAYMLLKDDNTSIFSDNENSVRLLRSENYIIRDRLYTGGNI